MATSTITYKNIPYEILDLVSHILDPKTLALGSCVSKTWYKIMSSNHLWEQPCTTTFPSLIHLRTTTVPPLSYNCLFGIGHTALKRRQQQPSNPKITLQNLLFIITLTNENSQYPVTIIKPGTSMVTSDIEPKQLFRFDIDVRDHEKWLKFEVLDNTKVTWNVVLKGYESVFTMMDCKGNKGSFVSGSDGWFSAELPAAGCCCAAASSSGMMADMRLVMKEGESQEMVVERISVGVLSIVSWRYVCVDDGLRYLQHFLQPCSK